jgi:anti-sigma regulatory factor (Ser/Thr protein kinase)
MRQDSIWLRFPAVMGHSVTVMAAHPVHQVTSPATSGAGWQWLHGAAEMAAATGAAELAPTALSAGTLSSPALSRPAPGTPGWTCFPRIAMRTPTAEPGSVSAARRFTAATLARWGVAERESDVAVVVSELLSNALRHGLALAAAGPCDRPIRLGLVHSGPTLLCAVADPSDELPIPRDPSWLDESGRGLHVIASLSDSWGACAAHGRPGKVVWATFATAR